MGTNDQLEIDVENAAKVAALDGSEGWGFVKTWMEQGRAVHDQDLKSFKYIADHEGYLTALARYNAYNDILMFIDNTIQQGQLSQKELDARAREDS